MRNNLWEHVNSVKDWANNDGNFFEDGIGSEKERVLLCPSFNKFLILIEKFFFFLYFVFFQIVIYDKGLYVGL